MEIIAQGLDKDKSIWDYMTREEEGANCFYHLAIDIDNPDAFALPHTGGTELLQTVLMMLAFVGIGIGMMKLRRRR